MFKNPIRSYLEKKHPQRSIAEIASEVDSRHEAIARGVAQRFSRGNTSIQRGAFLTQKDVDDRNKKRD